MLAEAYVQPGHDLSYEHVTVAESDGHVVGMGAGYTTAKHRASVDGGLARALEGSRVGRSRSAALAKWLRYFGPRSDQEFYVWVVIVSEGFRGQGIGTCLLDHLEAQAGELGATILCLDAEAKNKRVRGFYEQRGMTLESEWPTVPLVPAMVVRMTKHL